MNVFHKHVWITCVIKVFFTVWFGTWIYDNFHIPIGNFQSIYLRKYHFPSYYTICNFKKTLNIIKLWNNIVNVFNWNLVHIVCVPYPESIKLRWTCHPRMTVGSAQNCPFSNDSLTKSKVTLVVILRLQFPKGSVDALWWMNLSAITQSTRLANAIGAGFPIVWCR